VILLSSVNFRNKKKNSRLTDTLQGDTHSITFMGSV